jgi:chorismate dehydratase
MSGPRVGKISYLNTTPFFYKWPEDKFPIVPGVPRELAKAARAGQIIAAPLPIVECWDMEDSFSPLGAWGITAMKECRSVLVFSKRPFSELNATTIGATQESSTSVVLCDVLIRHRYKHKVRLRRGLENKDEAWLVIGDSALGMIETARKEWPYVTDLAAEWWDWQKLPFVFARWVVNKKNPDLASAISSALETSLSAGLKSLDAIAKKEATVLSMSPHQIVSYLKVFNYKINEEAEGAIQLFRQLAHRVPELAAAGA